MIRSHRVLSARSKKLLFLCFGIAFFAALSHQAHQAQYGWADVIAATGAKENRASTVLVGLVRTVRTERALFVNPPGEPEKWVEDERILTARAHYATSGELTEKTEYAPDGAAIVRVVQAYNQANKLTAERLYNSNDMLWRNTAYTYDEAGRLTEAISTDTDGELWFRDVYAYNQHGQPSQVDHHDPDGSFLHRAIYTYDSEGRIVERSLSDADGSRISSNAYTYDTNGKMSEVTTQGRNGSLTSRWIYAYDERGNEREWIAYKADGSIRRKEVYAYTYDAKGNWVKQITSEWIPDGGAGYLEPAEAVYRGITYYDETQVGPAVAGPAIRDQKKSDEPR